MNRPAGQSGIELDRLRELLLRPETDRLGAVETRVDALDARVGTADRLEAATADILVDAFRRAEIAQHRELASAIAPVVVAAIRSEIKNSRDMMVEALYPITGRLVAAAVANAFRDLVAELNERLDRTLSTHYWKLRLRSLQTGRPMSELALADAQQPTLRRLLLLERGSGRLIAAWHANDEEDAQSELVSGLIAAITEFASSVYGARAGELRTLDLGGARVFLRGAPVYLIAAECAGALKPEHERELDGAFLSLVSHIDHKPEDAQPALARMAQTLFQPTPERAKSRLPLLVVTAGLVATAAWFASGPILRGIKERKIEAAFAEAIAARPELAAYPLHVAVDHAAKTATIEGLDPSSAAVGSLSAAIAGAAAPYSVVERTEAVSAAAQVESLQRRVEASDAQISALRAQIASATAQTSAAVHELQVQERADSDRLTATIAATAPSQRDRVAAQLARTAIFFSQAAVLANPELAARRADEIAAALKGNDLSIRVVGRADVSGGERSNAAIAQARAEEVIAMLAQRGVDPGRLKAIARPGVAAANADPRDRRVTFELAYDDEIHP